MQRCEIYANKAQQAINDRLAEGWRVVACSLDGTLALVVYEVPNDGQATPQKTGSLPGNPDPSLGAGTDPELQRLSAPIVRQAGGDPETYRSIVVGEGLNRHGVVVRVDGFRNSEQYMQNPVVYYDHAWLANMGGFLSSPSPPSEGSLPIGKALNHWSTTVPAGADGADVPALGFDFAFAGTPFAQTVRQLVDERVLNMTSIGFIPVDMVVEKQDGEDIPTFTSWDLIEFSVVGIPADPSAAIVHGLSPRVQSLIAQLNAEQDRQRTQEPRTAAVAGQPGSWRDVWADHIKKGRGT